MAFGTEAQKDRFIPPITAAEEFWGQGFSEPGSGSDLASLRTSARLEGDRWVINGQKIWMTFGNHAHWLYVLCRTNRDVPKHKGISMLLVPRHQKGVEVRTIKNIAGGSEFCEVFFTDAETSADMVIGEVDAGWKIVMATLGNERGGTTVLPYLASFERQMEDLLDFLRGSPERIDAVMIDRVVKSWQEYQVLRRHTERLLDAVLSGQHPGPESSLVKLFWGTWHRDFGELLIDVHGSDAVLAEQPGSPLAEHRRIFLNARAETIYGGTVEIQKNIIAERVLGLPR
jgi:alkylation response protein AidB-like acyl-CoA dehydrogenase